MSIKSRASTIINNKFIDIDEYSQDSCELLMRIDGNLLLGDHDANTTRTTTRSRNKTNETAEVADEEHITKYSKMSNTSTKHDPFQVNTRRVLTLSEQVTAINAYKRLKTINGVAKMFNCTWKNIKGILKNQKIILQEYARKNKSNTQELQRRSRICFLGICVYEFIQRAQFHKNFDLHELKLMLLAGQFAELLQIEKFTANKVWINHFKADYNISLSQRKIVLTRTPPASLDLNDIIDYCREKADGESSQSAAAAKEVVDIQESEEDVDNAHDDVQLTIVVENEGAATEVSSAQHADDTELKPNISEIEIEQQSSVAITTAQNVGQPADTEELDIKPDIVKIKIEPVIQRDKEQEEDEEPVCKKSRLDVVHDPGTDDLHSTNLKSEETECGPQPSEDLQENINDQQPSTSHDHHKTTEADAETQPCIQVNSYSDALKLLKPLEEFAMLQENYRMIGLIAQLEEISKNPPKIITHRM